MTESMAKRFAVYVHEYIYIYIYAALTVLIVLAVLVRTVLVTSNPSVGFQLRWLSASLAFSFVVALFLFLLTCVV